MYLPENELKLLFPNISDVIADYCGIQLDADDTRIKAACNIAQDLDISFVILTENFQRCFVDNANYSAELYALATPCVAFFTYARLLEMFQGSYTDSGYAVESEAVSIDEAKIASKKYRAVGEVYLGKMVQFLEDENSSTDASMEFSVQRVRSFGGEEIPSPGSGSFGIYGDTFAGRDYSYLLGRRKNIRDR